MVRFLSGTDFFHLPRVINEKQQRRGHHKEGGGFSSEKRREYKTKGGTKIELI